MNIRLTNSELEELISQIAHRICRHKYKPGEETFVAAILRQELQEAEKQAALREIPYRRHGRKESVHAQ